jgi:hypothetical protein
MLDIYTVDEGIKNEYDWWLGNCLESTHLED